MKLGTAILEFCTLIAAFAALYYMLTFTCVALHGADVCFS